MTIIFLRWKQIAIQSAESPFQKRMANSKQMLRQTKWRSFEDSNGFLWTYDSLLKKTKQMWLCEFHSNKIFTKKRLFCAKLCKNFIRMPQNSWYLKNVKGITAWQLRPAYVTAFQRRSFAWNYIIIYQPKGELYNGYKCCLNKTDCTLYCILFCYASLSSFISDKIYFHVFVATISQYVENQCKK